MKPSQQINSHEQRKLKLIDSECIMKNKSIAANAEWMNAAGATNLR